MSTMSPGGGAPPDAAPVCPRHPQREAYVRCQRCERPTCPECQRPAAVGIQCVDCVKEGARSIRTPRTVLGGRVGDGRPVVTQTIIAVTAVAFLLQLAVPGFTGELYFYSRYAVSEPWRFLTATFVHQQGSVLHVLVNMYLLWLVGPQLEQLAGRVRFGLLYVLGGVGGAVAFFLLAVPSANPAASWNLTLSGSSGAVFAVFGAYLVINRRLNRDSGLILGLVALNFVLALFSGNHASWQMHLGGLATGAAIGAALAFVPRERRAVVQPLAIGGIAVLLVLAVLLKVATIPDGLLA